MSAWWVLSPMVLFGLLLCLERVESRIVAPIDRAVLVRRLMERSPADDIEREVAELFAPLAARERSSKHSR